VPGQLGYQVRNWRPVIISPDNEVTTSRLTLHSSHVPGQLDSVTSSRRVSGQVKRALVIQARLLVLLSEQGTQLLFSQNRFDNDSHVFSPNIIAARVYGLDTRWADHEADA
jgi:hypothetical protein